MAPGRLADLLDRGTRLLSDYIRTGRTDTRRLREAAEVIVEIRGMHTTSNGAADWGGRTHAYREVAADLYRRAGVPRDDLDGVQAALRYHIGNILRDRLSPEELADAGLKPSSPRQRIRDTREATAALIHAIDPDRRVHGRADAAVILASCVALAEMLTPDRLVDLSPERRVATRLALDDLARLLDDVRDALDQARGGEPAP